MEFEELVKAFREEEVKTLKQAFTKTLDNDLNISSALGALFNFVRKANTALNRQGLSEADKEEILKTLQELNEVLNVLTFSLPEIDPEVFVLIKERERARRQRDWEKADRIRMQLAEKGIELIDTPQGTIWRKKHDKSLS